MAKQLSVLETKRQIVQASIDMGEEPCVLLAFAGIESGGTFNNLIVGGKKKDYWGTMQLSNGYGGCTGGERFDPYKATICTINKMRVNRDAITKKFGDVWKPFFMYMAHQQGLGGFNFAFKNQNRKINELPSDKQDSIRANIGKKAVYVYELLQYYEKKFNKYTSGCSITCTNDLKGLSGIVKEDDNTIIVGNCIVRTNYEKKNIETIHTKHRNFFSFYSY